MSQSRQSLIPSFKTLLLMAVLGWVYWPTLLELYEIWTTSPDYSHGMLVPFFSAWLLLRQPLSTQAVRPWPVIGFIGLSLAMACRLLGAGTSFLPLEGISLVFALTALVLMNRGWAGLRWAWQALFFLVFMIPLPYEFSRVMGAELQRVATMCSTFLLRCCGQPAIAEGNRILIENVTLNVVEACSGLRMLMTFIAFSIGAVFVMERHWIVKGIVLLSAIPIALLTNVLRISATGLAHVWLPEGEQKVKLMDFIHDFNGWMMMPIGLLFLLLELWVLKHLLIEKAPRAVLSVTPQPVASETPTEAVRMRPTGKPKFVSVIRMPQAGS